MSLVMATGPAIRKTEPWPYDVVVNSYGLMCGDPDRGVKSAGIAGEKPDDMAAVAPTEFTYGALNPRLGAITPYDEMPLGMGLRTQVAREDQQYRYTVNANLAYETWQKGPAMTTVSPATHDAKPVNRAWEMGTSLYWLNGRYAMKMDSGGVVSVSQDFGVGKTAMDVVVFWSNAGTQSYAYVAMGDADNAWRFDGTTWVQHAGTLRARAWAVVGRNIWKASNRNLITLCNLDADPWVEANWAAPNAYYVGSKDYQITRLIVAPGGQLIAFKEDGPWVFDLQDLDRPLYPFLLQNPDPVGGEAYGTWIESMYASWGKGTFKIDPGLGVEPMGLDRLTGNDSPVQGRMTAYAGHETYCMYAGLYNDDTGTAYLCQYGGWRRGETGESERVDAWHGSISEAFVGLKITLLFTTAVGAPSGHDRMAVGLSDGTLRFFVLPCVANPIGCSAFRWSIADGEVYLPTWTGTFDANVKALRSETVYALNFSSTNWVEVAYKLTPSQVSWTPMDAVFNSGVQETVRYPFATSATLVDLKVTLKSTVTTDTPRVRGLGHAWQLHTDFRRVRTVPVLAADGLVDREGKALRWGAAAIVAILRQAHDAPAGVLVAFPDGTSSYNKVIGWRDVLAWDRRLEGWRQAVEVSLGEVIDDTLPTGAWNGKYHWNGEARWG